MICEPCKERVRTQQLSAGGKSDNFWGGWGVNLNSIAIKVKVKEGNIMIILPAHHSPIIHEQIVKQCQKSKVSGILGEVIWKS